MQINFTEVIIALIGIVFTGVIIPLVKAAFDWLKEKTQNEALSSALEEAKQIADGIVAGLSANLVEGLKEKSEDGKLTSSEAKAVMDEGIRRFLCDVSEKTLNVIENNADDISAYIGNLIESRLVILKDQGGQ